MYLFTAPVQNEFLVWLYESKETTHHDHIPMLNMEGGPCPSMFVADIAMSTVPFRKL